MPRALRVPLEAWPAQDRRLWQRATTSLDYFDTQAAAAHWSAKTRYQAAAAYGRWLAFLTEHEPDALESAPAARVDQARLHRYVEGELSSALVTQPPTVLSRARLALWEKVAPLSLHIGLVRVSLGTEPMIDILFDTSDNNRHLRPTAYVAFQQGVPWLLERWNEICGDDLDLGTLVRAW